MLSTLQEHTHRQPVGPVVAMVVRLKHPAAIPSPPTRQDVCSNVSLYLRIAFKCFKIGKKHMDSWLHLYPFI